MSAEKQEYLNGFKEGYRIAEGEVLVTYGGQEYKVMVEENGVWVRNYDDMAKFVDGKSFNMEAWKVFSFGVEEKDGQISINEADYNALKAAMIKFYETMDKNQLGVADVEGTGNGDHDTLTGERELLLRFTDRTPPRLIGLAGNGPLRVGALGIGNGGVVMIAYFGGEGLGYKQSSYNLDSVEQVMTRIAGGNETVGNINFLCLMTSESVNPEPNYTIGSPEMEKIARRVAEGYGLSFEEFVKIVGDPFGWGDKTTVEVLQALFKLNQPVLVYEARFMNEEGK